MENNGNQNLASSLCKAGCGFFGTGHYDGMCSKCYKDFVKRKNDSSTSLTVNACTSQAAVAAESQDKASDLPSLPNTTPSVDTAKPTIQSVNQLKADAGSETGSASGSISSVSGGEDSGTEGSPTKSRKRNRCSSCKRKVGLTGFECRCGGLYCSIHRYSDKHSCEFDYKELGADHIRKNNPVVVGSKVQKL